MQIVKNNFYIIIGGPGSGKTTIIAALKKQGFLCIDEAARQIIQEQLKLMAMRFIGKIKLNFVT